MRSSKQPFSRELEGKPSYLSGMGITLWTCCIQGAFLDLVAYQFYTEKVFLVDKPTGDTMHQFAVFKKVSYNNLNRKKFHTIECQNLDMFIKIDFYQMFFLLYKYASNQKRGLLEKVVITHFGASR